MAAGKTMTEPLPLSKDERSQIRLAFMRLVPVADEIAVALYRRLFEIAPEARALFPEDLTEQRAKLIQMLIMVVGSLEESEILGKLARESGARHRGYGAKPEHFEPVGAALLYAIQTTAVPTPSADEMALWVRLYSHVSYHMLAGLEAA